ncbi:MAG: hypothetical protein KGZ83_12365 [Sulfuricella sp.]|nr:hypothetical protein [Sulfuricella sp.]
MAVNSVTSNTSLQAFFTQQKSAVIQQSDIARHAEQASKATQADRLRHPDLVNRSETHPSPVVNPQGQTTGTLINTVA